MKKLVYTVISVMFSVNLTAEIVNTCAVKLVDAQQSYVKLEELISFHSGSPELAPLYDHFRRVKREIKRLTECAQRTSMLLESLSLMNPELYIEISNIRDADYKTVDVYIKVSEDEEMAKSVFGITHFSQDTAQLHSPMTKFGPETIIIQIRHCSSPRMLRYLIHELAHVKFIVPNLVTYLEYYYQKYSPENLNSPTWDTIQMIPVTFLFGKN